jgi:endonuclease YncB( thermonuclease family)
MTVLAKLLLASAALAVGIASAVAQTGAITVLDGDTVVLNAKTYRLVGFDAPETGERRNALLRGSWAAWHGRACRRSSTAAASWS